MRFSSRTSRLSPSAMPGSKANMNWQEQAANLERRSRELRAKAGRKEIIECMDKNPACIEHLLSKLEALDMRSADLQEQALPEPPMSAQARAAQQRKAKAKAGSAKEAEEENTGAKVATVPTKYTTIASCSPSYLSEIFLEAIEPLSLSVANLKRVQLRGQTERNRDSLCRIIEAATGLPRDTPLVSKLSRVVSLQEYLRARNGSRGRRCADIPLPPAWPRDGIYDVRVTDVEIILRQKYSGETHALSRSVLAEPNAAMIEIDRNWSEVSACLVSKNDLDDQYHFGNHFTKHVVSGDASQGAQLPKRLQMFTDAASSEAAPPKRLKMLADDAGGKPLALLDAASGGGSSTQSADGSSHDSGGDSQDLDGTGGSSQDSRAAQSGSGAINSPTEGAPHGGLTPAPTQGASAASPAEPADDDAEKELEEALAAATGEGNGCEDDEAGVADAPEAAPPTSMTVFDEANEMPPPPAE